MQVMLAWALKLGRLAFQLLFWRQRKSRDVPLSAEQGTGAGAGVWQGWLWLRSR